MSASGRKVVVPVRPPYRLDLTATVLRRLSTNAVDLFDGKTYRRLLDDGDRTVLLEVEQTSPTQLDVIAAPECSDLEGRVARLLGAHVDLTPFYNGAAEFDWLGRLVTAARGVKPPRYPSLWEAVVNAVVFQQVSIHAAAAILRRVIERFAEPQIHGAITLLPFPQPHVIVDADPVDLRAAGLSTNKIVALRTLARAVLDGQLDGVRFESLATTDFVEQLQHFKGIGPWTAAVIALRGFGRLDIFPMRDSGVARTLKDLSNDPNIDADAILARLGAQRGMLYYHLLLGRLMASGNLVLT